MAIKKKEEQPRKILLGRPKANLKMGLVGMPNVGKSSTFNILSKQSVPAENYPFCTIDPSEAKVVVNDERFDKLCSIYNPKSSIPGALFIVDIAGLVQGAHEGEGLGNAFLSHISSVDGIYQVVRAFDDDEVTHTCGNVDPVRDLEIITNELRFKDIERCQKLHDELDRVVSRGQDKAKKSDFEIIKKVLDLLNDGRWVITKTDWSIKEIEFLNELQLLTAKPMVYLINMSEKDYIRKKNKFLPKIFQWVEENIPGKIIPYSVAFENKFAEGQITDGTPSAYDKIVAAGYEALNLKYYFTCGKDEVKCWTFREGTKAPQAAGLIHTDMERGFICAEVTKYADLIEYGSDAAVKSAGKTATRGKEYVVEDGDVMFFKFNPSGGGKK